MFEFWPVIGPTFYFSIIQFYILITISLYILYQKMIQSAEIERKQLKILIISMLISFAGGSTTYLLCLNIEIAPYGNILIPTFILSFIYLILKYQIMDIRVALSRSFVYTIIIFLITMFYFIATYISELYLKEIIGYKSFIFSLLYASIIAIAFIPLKERLQKIVDKIFLKKSIKEIEMENELLRQEIIRTERLKTVAILASGMAHEIKNPLTPIKTFAEQLPQRLDDKEFLLKFSRIISNEVERIDTLVTELLDYAKPTPPKLKTSNIHQLIDHTIDFLNNDLIKNQITLSKDYQLPTSQLIRIDENQFRQVFLNIFLNAIDAMPNGGLLTITTGFPIKSFGNDRNCIITIEDTGKGIAAEDIAHIFDPFFSKKDRGTGLGLAITHEIIKNHNGKILVESQVAAGTKFIIELPITHPYETTQ